MKHLIGQRKGFGKSGLGIGNAEKVLIGDNNQRIHFLRQPFNTLNRRTRPPIAFKVKRLGDNADSQNTGIAGGAGNHWCRTGSGAAAHASRDESHMRALQHIDNFRHGLFRRALPDFRIGTGAEAFGQLAAHLDTAIAFAGRQRLRVGIGHNKVNTLKTGGNHVIDRIATGSANADNHNAGFKLPFRGDCKLNTHDLSPFQSN